MKGIKEKKGEDPMKLVELFLKNELEMENPPTLQTAFRIRKGKYLAISFKLLNEAKVGAIFEHVKNLKGKVNDIDRYYNLDEHLTEANLDKKTKETSYQERISPNANKSSTRD